MQVPGLVKVVVNMGVGEAARDAKLIDGAVRDLTTITVRSRLCAGRPSPSRSSSCVRACRSARGHPPQRPDVGVLDRLLSIALPVSATSAALDGRKLDGHGNYTFGLTEQSVFHEIDQDRIDRTRGMDITVVTTAKTDDEAGRFSSSWASRSRRLSMAKKALIIKAPRSRSSPCVRTPAARSAVRPHSVYRKFGLCRVACGTWLNRGELPGVSKASW